MGCTPSANPHNCRTLYDAIAGYRREARISGDRFLKPIKKTKELINADIRYLLSIGTDPNQTWKGGGWDTPLLLVAGYDSFAESAEDNHEAIRILVAAGANVEAKSDNGMTAIQAAARICRPNCVSALLDVGAQTQFGETTLLHWLIQNGFVNKSFSGFEGGIRDDMRLRENSRALFGVLLEKTELVHSKDAKGRTPLHLMLDQSMRIHHEFSKSFFEILLEGGASTEAVDSENRTVLHVAAESNLEFLKLVLTAAQPPPVDPIDKDGWTPLHLASRNGRSNTVIALLEHAKPEVDKTGGPCSWTALHCAGNGQTDGQNIVNALVKHGADVNVRDKEGKTPLHIVAECSGRKSDKCYHRWKDPSNHQWLHPRHKVVHPHHKVVQDLLNAGAQVDAKDKDGMTPLHVGVLHNGSDETIKMLCEVGGANHQARDHRGRTPLDLATSTAVAQLLMALERIQMNRQNNRGISNCQPVTEQPVTGGFFI